MIGKTISHYKLIEKLGEGGMGVVFKAHDTKLDRFVALKFLPSHLTKSQIEKDRFIQEAKAASAINHPNVCIIYDLQEHEDQQFIIMEYVDGETLSDKIKSNKLNKKEAIDYAIQIADALKTAHEKGVIHRDIKSENIMITSTGQVKVMDFGLAKLKGSLKLTKTSSTIGTLAYMSPEQIQGQEIDARSDIFSFGVVLYEMLCGHLPFQGEYDSAIMYSILNNDPEPIQKYYPDSPSEMIHILDRSLEKESGERYQAINEVLIELKRIKREKSIFLKREQNSDSGSYWKNKNKIIISFFIILATILSLFLIYKTIFGSKPQWMNIENLSLKQLTNEEGVEEGRISPDEKYLIYTNKARLFLKELSQNIVTNIFPDSNFAYYYPSWHPQSTYLLFAGSNSDKNHFLFITNTTGKIIHQIPTLYPIYSPSWSPDGTMIAYYKEAIEQHEITIMDYKTKETRNWRIDSACYELSWSPDSRKIAFLEFVDFYKGLIRILDVKTGFTTKSLKYINNALWYPWVDGLTWSPDGKFLVYVGRVDDSNRLNCELYTILMDKSGFFTKEPAKRITFTEEYYIPALPSFSKDGKKLSFGRYRNDWNIYSMAISLNTLKITGPIREIATSTGRDIQPSWTNNEEAILYRSNKERYWDIFRLDIKSKEEYQLTNSKDIESNPMEIPNMNEISFHCNYGIWKISNDGGQAELLTPKNLKLFSNYLWTPDGNNIIAIKRDSTNLFKTNLIKYIELKFQDSAIS